MRKIAIIIISLLALAIGYGSYKYYYEETENLNSVYLIPRDAIYFAVSHKPIKNWELVRDSETWQHLQTNAYFAELTSTANTLDTILRENKKLFDLLGSKKLIVSTHPISKRKYDYLFVVDLKKTAKLLQFKTILKKIFEDDFRITERMYKGVEILEFFDNKTRETLSMSLINNNLIASYTHTLVEASIDQLNEPTIGRDLKFIEINQKVKDDKLLRLFVQYNFVDEFTLMLTNTSEKWINDMSKSLVFSGFDIDLIRGKKIIAKGYTNTNDNNISYLEAFQNSGLGTQGIAKVAPQRTSMYLSLGFDDFNKFYTNYQTLQQENVVAYDKFEKNKQQIEKLLDIDVQQHFIDWIDNEIALLKLEPVNQVEKSIESDFALVLKAKDSDEAVKNLNFILERIKKKTPVKFKQVDYKGYPIKFMSIKGFFKLFLGGYFKDLINPYYTIIDDYVVFSNHPNTLKYIITDYIEKNTLIKSVNYKEFKSNFANKSNLFVYINTPMLYPNLIKSVDASTQIQLKKNKQYFTSFSQIGIQLMPKDDVFKSTLVVQYRDQESLYYSDEFKPLTVGPQEQVQQPKEEPIVVSENTDPFDVIEINPDDLNAEEFVLEYKNGEIKVEVPLKDGMKNGWYKTYYENGELYFKGKFKDDKRVGKWKKYDMEGKKILTVNY